ncbi:Chaperone protein DnaJ [Candidatus Nitrosotalea sp. TS]|uniref:DnaJ domain-containing protein n=1 Tax=Candidatus Nitrosotalea sp. TS TaxID=2341020 RepID=UPI00140DA5C0|nr:DnaJ domain-containing protein [Candidatus Nitrosotalea sp. TS]NHI03177.1 Chaperone protein DnaJ [Candidatus Nitrosotalea sp. TS]
MNNCTCYRLLGLEKGASVREIKDAYRKMALKYHPDKSVSKQDNEKFKLIHEAYQILRTDHVRCMGELTRLKPNDQVPRDNGTDSKVSYWNEFHPNKILKKNWRKYTKYAEKAYHDFCKYEDEMWDYSEKVIKRTTLFVPLVVTRQTRVSLLFVSQVYDPLLKKGKYTGVRLKNRLKLLNKNI